MTSGPISDELSVEGPILSFLILGVIASINSLAVRSVTGTATEIAMQRSPAEP